MLTRQRLQRLVRLRERLEREQELRVREAARLRDLRAGAAGRTLGLRERALALRPAAHAELDAASSYLTRVNRELRARRSALAHSINEFEGERAALVARRQDREALGVLLERAAAERRAARGRAELDRIDEHVAYRQARRSAPRGGMR